MDNESTDTSKPFEDENLLHITFTPELRPAKLKHRCLAFLMDAVMGIIILITVLQFTLPKRYPGAFEELSYAMERQDSLSAEERAQGMDGLGLTQNTKDMIAFGQSLSIFTLWLYFLVSELAFSNGSLGKKTVRIRVININTLERPRLGEACLRSAIKTISLIVLVPVLWIDYFLALFTRQRRAGHDFICRTLVIDEADMYE